MGCVVYSKLTQCMRCDNGQAHLDILSAMQRYAAVNVAAVAASLPAARVLRALREVYWFPEEAVAGAQPSVLPRPHVISAVSAVASYLLMLGSQRDAGCERYRRLCGSCVLVCWGCWRALSCQEASLEHGPGRWLLS